MIYFDYTANTPVDLSVLDAYCKAEKEYIGNPNSQHPLGQAAREELAHTTEQIAQLLSVQSSEIIYTSGASESNNLALKGITEAFKSQNPDGGRHIISTALEHSSISETLTTLKKQNYEIDLVNIQSDGTIDLDQLRELLRPDTILVSVCAVDGELGVIQPIRQIADILSDYPGCRFHVDAAQAVGKTDLILDGVDTMTIAPHKFYGLNGTGLLFKRQNLELEPQIHGGASTTRYRSGTPTVALAVSTEKALELALNHAEERIAFVRELNAYLRTALSRYPAVRMNSPEEKSVPHILNLSVQGIKGTRFQRTLSQYGVCVSVRSACSADNIAYSKAVYAVSHDLRNALSSWRISLSHLTTKEEIDEFLDIFDRCYHELVP